jgi:hypothetical protein
VGEPATLGERPGVGDLVTAALWWTGALALMGVTLTLVVGPFAGALGCPGGCPDGESVMWRVGRLALGITGAYLAFAGAVGGAAYFSRRTRLAAVPLGLLGAALLVPVLLAASDALLGDADPWWPVIVFLGLGLPGIALLLASWRVATHPGQAGRSLAS